MSRVSFRILAALVLVGACLWVPAAVRATQSVKHQACTIIRLNRGFDVPVEKEFVVPADTVSMVSATVAHEARTATVTVHGRLEPGDTLPASADTLAPDLLRGPPASSVA